MSDQPLKIGELASALEAEETPWEYEETDLFKLSPEEQVLRLGYTPGPDEPSLESREELATANLEAFTAGGFAAAAAPASFDWRNVGGRNFITAVRNQGGCGSCVAFGTAAAVEGSLRVRINDPTYPIDLSEAHLFYCHARSQGRRCNNGWWVPPALDKLKDPGVADEACYPYTAGDQDCTNLCSNWQNRVARLSGWHAINSIADMKEWLSRSGPLVACYTVYADFFAYSSGIYRHVSGDVRGGHCVCCVGYNDAQRYWIMKNSWGSSWGEAGYFRIAYGQCGIDATMWAIDGFTTGVWQNNKRVTGLWTINQDRNAWVFIAGLGWKRIAYNNDNIFFSMLSDLVAAKAANRPVNFYEVQGLIRQVYVL